MSPTQARTAPDARLQRLLGGDALAALRLRLRRYFERRAVDVDASVAAATGAAAEGVLHLSKLSPIEVEAITQLMGRPTRSSRAATSSRSVRIDIAALNALLQGAGIAPTLSDALEQLDGPIVNRAATRQELQARWALALGAPLVHEALKGWLQSAASLSLLKRLARQDPDAARQLLTRADAVLQRLPAQGLTRAQLAADTLGNAHALDNGQATATLVLAVLQRADSLTDANADALANGHRGVAVGTLSDRQDSEEQPGDEADEVRLSASGRARDIWARAGVLVNELARPALFLNLPMQVNSRFQPLVGEPGFLSLRQLLRNPIAWAVAGLPVFVCENPNIVSIAADRLGASCAPLVCTEGMPAAAQRVLLTQLAQAGAKLFYHGDFDWAGLHIANQVMSLCGAQPWRLGSKDYEDAVRNAAHTERDLAKSTVDASWDAQLAPAMRCHGLAIAEEAVVASLLQDLD